MLPEQGRLTFILTNSMAFMALDGIVRHLDMEEDKELLAWGRLVMAAA